MKQLKNQDQIEEMRKRLYDRGSNVGSGARHQLSDTQVDVSRDWSDNKTENPSPNKTDLRQGMEVENTSSAEAGSTEIEDKPKKRSYRSFVLIGSLLIFIFVAGISSFFLYMGGNQISNENIQISVQGPSSVGGGEVTSFQVAVANHNTLPIESVTLILKYPQGTRSAGDSPRNLFEERIPVDDIAPGEVRNVPVQVAIFGEENSDKNIEATIEYRVNGSSGMFYKDANPLAIHISSSPLVLRVQSIEKVASGQLIDITLTAASNASTPLKDILVTASYPNGFTFESSSPSPIYGSDVWKIDELLPEETSSIKLRGVVSGQTEETFRINFEAGPSNPDNQYLVGATLAEGGFDFTIERPFIDVAILINNDDSRDVVISEEKKSDVEVSITNTLDETVYDMTVEVVPTGNALDENSIVSPSGFYDSNTGTVKWEVANNSSFDRVLPGDSRNLSFDVTQGPDKTTASFDMVVNVYARRVAESSAQETLIGSVQAKAKYSSTVSIGSQAGRNVGAFGDSGPIPPKVGEVSTYTLTLVAEAGANDLANTVVETSLPLYVDWLDIYDAEGVVTYNSVSKNLQWNIGNLGLGQRKEFTFQVSIKPSVSQINRTPVLLNTQKIKANDRFTGALLQDSASAVTTELSIEMGFPEDNGVVER